MRMFIARSLCLLTMLGIASIVTGVSAQADICKWIDENGVTHYAAECPEGVDSRQIEIEPPPPSRPDDMQTDGPTAPPGSEQELQKNRNDRQQ